MSEINVLSIVNDAFSTKKKKLIGITKILHYIAVERLSTDFKIGVSARNK